MEHPYHDGDGGDGDGGEHHQLTDSSDLCTYIYQIKGLEEINSTTLFIIQYFLLVKRLLLFIRK